MGPLYSKTTGPTCTHVLYCVVPNIIGTFNDAGIINDIIVNTPRDPHTRSYMFISSVEISPHLEIHCPQNITAFFNEALSCQFLSALQYNSNHIHKNANYVVNGAIALHVIM